jgi:ATP-dependent DNA helicase RecG
MTAYSDHELMEMLSDLESETTERKGSFKGDSPTTARQAACAFANDLSNRRRPGVIFIGALDDGSPSGIAITDELLLQLADMKTDGNIVPPPTLTVTKHTLRSHEMAVVTVWPADSPARSVQRPRLHPHRAAPRHRLGAG